MTRRQAMCQIACLLLCHTPHDRLSVFVFRTAPCVTYGFVALEGREGLLLFFKCVPL